MTYADARLDRLELAVQSLEATLRKLAADLAVVAGQARAQGAWPAFQSPSSGGGAAVRVCKTTTGVTASDATTPGGGTVQPLSLDGSGNYADDGATVAVKNAGVASSADVRGFAIKIDEDWWFTPEECG